MNDKTFKLLEFVKETPYLFEVLERSEELGIPNWYFGAGCLVQSYWNHRAGLPLERNIKDIDWIYFDPTDLSEKRERIIQDLVRKHFRDLPFEFDVNNQARVHLWYEESFGYPIRPYLSSEDAIQTWPTTATAVGLTKRNGHSLVFAPFGLDDFFSLVVRANKRQITKDIYSKKIERWKNCWPALEIISWEDSFV